MSAIRGLIDRVTSDAYGVTLELDNKVVIRLASNNGYLYINFSGIVIDKNIDVSEHWANGVNIRYEPRMR